MRWAQERARQTPTPGNVAYARQLEKEVDAALTELAYAEKQLRLNF